MLSAPPACKTQNYRLGGLNPHRDSKNGSDPVLLRISLHPTVQHMGLAEAGGWMTRPLVGCSTIPSLVGATSDIELGVSTISSAVHYASGLKRTRVFHKAPPAARAPQPTSVPSLAMLQVRVLYIIGNLFIFACVARRQWLGAGWGETSRRSLVCENCHGGDCLGN